MKFLVVFTFSFTVTTAVGNPETDPSTNYLSSLNDRNAFSPNARNISGKTKMSFYSEPKVKVLH